MTCPICRFSKKTIKNLDKKRISYCANCGGNVSVTYDFTFPNQKKEEKEK